ncbi:hypothetical protein ACFL5O_03205 [Myxococcota bacterium]
MAKPKRAPKKPERTPKRPRERRERRFSPQWTQGQTVSLVAGGLGCALAGAGVWAKWGSEPPHEFALYLMVAGVLLFGLGGWSLGVGGPVRVGDAGVATEKGSEIRRLVWCDIERISVRAGILRVEGKQQTLEIPLGTHRCAAAWVLSEAASRVPDVMDVKQSVVQELPVPKPEDGEMMPVIGLQVAGWHCAASGKAIAFERDARLCPNCGQVYHRMRVPKTCQTCEEGLGERAIPAV